MSPDFWSFPLGFPEFWRIQLPQSSSRRWAGVHLLINLLSKTQKNDRPTKELCWGLKDFRNRPTTFEITQRLAKFEKLLD